MAVVTLPQRQGIDYSKLGQVVGQAINPQAGLQEKLLPLLMAAQFKQKLQERSPLFQAKVKAQKALAKYREAAAKPDALEDILSIMGGLKKPEDVFTSRQVEGLTGVPQDVQQRPVVPHIAGGFVGGEVTEPGTRAKPPAEFIPDILRKRFGVTEEEASRKALGLPKVVAPKTPTAIQITRLAQAEATRRVGGSFAVAARKEEYLKLVERLKKEFSAEFGATETGVAGLDEQEIDDNVDVLDINF